MTPLEHVLLLGPIPWRWPGHSDVVLLIVYVVALRPLRRAYIFNQ